MRGSILSLSVYNDYYLLLKYYLIYIFRTKNLGTNHYENP